VSVLLRPSLYIITVKKGSKPPTPPPAEGIQQQLEDEKANNLRPAVMILYNEDITENTGIIYNEGRSKTLTKIDGSDDVGEEIILGDNNSSDSYDGEASVDDDDD